MTVWTGNFGDGKGDWVNISGGSTSVLLSLKCAANPPQYFGYGYTLGSPSPTNNFFYCGNGYNHILQFICGTGSCAQGGW